MSSNSINWWVMKVETYCWRSLPGQQPGRCPGLWAVAWVVRRLSWVMWQRIRGGWCHKMRYTNRRLTFFTFYIVTIQLKHFKTGCSKVAIMGCLDGPCYCDHTSQCDRRKKAGGRKKKGQNLHQHSLMLTFTRHPTFMLSPFTQRKWIIECFYFSGRTPHPQDSRVVAGVSLVTLTAPLLPTELENSWIVNDVCCWICGCKLWPLAALLILFSVLYRGFCVNIWCQR